MAKNRAREEFQRYGGQYSPNAGFSEKNGEVREFPEKIYCESLRGYLLLGIRSLRWNCPAGKFCGLRAIFLPPRTEMIP